LLTEEYPPMTFSDHGKPAGLAANGRVAVNFAPGDIPHDETIRVTGPNVNATGTANFDRNGSLSVLNFTSVKMGPQNDLSFTLTRTQTENDYVLRGLSLDGSLIGRDVGESGPITNRGAANGGPHDETPMGPFHIDARLDRLAMRDGVVPPTINVDEPDPQCDLDYIPETGRKVQIEHAVANCIAFGSKNSALVLRRL